MGKFKSRAHPRLAPTYNDSVHSWCLFSARDWPDDALSPVHGPPYLIPGRPHFPGGETESRGGHVNPQSQTARKGVAVASIPGAGIPELVLAVPAPPTGGGEPANEWRSERRPWGCQLTVAGCHLGEAFRIRFRCTGLGTVRERGGISADLPRVRSPAQCRGRPASWSIRLQLRNIPFVSSHGAVHTAAGEPVCTPRGARGLAAPECWGPRPGPGPCPGALRGICQRSFLAAYPKAGEGEGRRVAGASLPSPQPRDPALPFPR